MFKRIILASALALFSISPGCAQSFATRQSPGVSTTPGFFAAVQTCEVQMQRMANLNKTLAANYNPERAYDECVTSTHEEVASQ
jgi:hypothetical protein